MINFDRVLCFSDFHAPYQHKDALRFLKAVKAEYSPTAIISVGDELDSHAMSFWPSEIDLANATEELMQGRKVIAGLAELFPELLCVESNHTDRLYRAGKRANIPKELLVPYKTMLGVQDYNWSWQFERRLYIKGQHVVFVHNGGSNVLLTSQRHGCSVVAGHIHTKQKIEYWQSPYGRSYGMQVGCLVDHTSPAYRYSIGQVIQPLLGCSVIISGVPKLIEMNLKRNGRWNNKIN